MRRRSCRFGFDALAQIGTHGEEPAILQGDARQHVLRSQVLIASGSWCLAPGYYHVFANYYGVTRNGAESSSGTAQHYTKYVGPLRIR